MSEYVLSSNYFEYIRLQRQLRKAISKKQLKRIDELTETTRKVYSKLTDYETQYADWVCNEIFEYRPISNSYHGVNVKEITDEIKALADYISKEKIVHKYMQRKETYNCLAAAKELGIQDFEKYYRKYSNVNKRFTQLCALRAAMRGKLHFSQSSNLQYLRDNLGIYGKDWDQCPASGKWCGTITLEDQREWVDEIAHEFWPEEEIKITKPKIRKDPSKPWWQKAIDAVLG